MGAHAESNVNFDFGLALTLARDFWAMAGTVSAYQSQRVGYAKTALEGWSGRFAQDFTGKLSTANATAAELEDGCRSVARLWAQAWAHAAAQQQNIEWSRYCQHKDNSRSGLQKAWDSIFGDPTKLPPAPSPPATPSPPDFAPTMDPMSYTPPPGY